MEIYLDNCATTRTDEDTAQVALELMTGEYGNPSSLHGKGLSAQLRLDAARRQLADAFGCGPDEVVFTSGGTESNNLALLGAAAVRRRKGGTIVANAAEHSSVVEPLKSLEKQGFTVKWIKPLPDGYADQQALIDSVDEDTILLTCMLVNSEIGAIAPIREIAEGAKHRKPDLLVHCDAVQGFGKLPFSAKKLGADLVSVSGHKLHAPKGCGALYIKKGVRILPLLHGGPQENGLRPGTESTPLACAFGYAAAKSAAEMERNLAHVTALHQYFVNKLQIMDGICINSPADGTPYLCNLSVPGYRSEILLHYLAQRGIFVSSGSACSKGRSSRVLAAMGLAPERIDSALRVSFSRYSTTEEIDLFLNTLSRAMEETIRSKR